MNSGDTLGKCCVSDMMQQAKTVPRSISRAWGPTIGATATLYPSCSYPARASPCRAAADAGQQQVIQINDAIWERYMWSTDTNSMKNSHECKLSSLSKPKWQHKLPWCRHGSVIGSGLRGERMGTDSLSVCISGVPTMAECKEQNGSS